MAAAVAVPFVHPGLLLAAVLAGTAAALLLPPRPWRPWAVLGLGLGAAALLALLGVLPWTGTLHLAAHGACMAAGFLLGGGMIARRAPRIGVPLAQVADITVAALVAGVAGARARYVWERWERFATAPDGHPRAWTEILARAADIDGGGAVWYGGLVLAALAVVLYARWRRIALLPLADLMAPAILAGLAIGRIGCFLNGCCYGGPCDLPWAVPSPVDPGVRVHPAQLYETLVAGGLAALLWWRWPRRRGDGAIAFWAVVGYAAWRFINEALRGDLDIPRVLGLTPSQLTSLELVAAALAVAAWRRWRGARSAGAAVDRRP